MANWKNAPLVYTIGMVQFPKVPNIARFIDAFLDKIRSQYPLEGAVSTPVISANFGPEGLQVSQQESKLWQFSSVDKGWGFILNDQSLCLHTTRYHDFVDFATRFKFGIDALLAVPDIGIVWTTAVGIRYVDMVTPGSGATLSEYLQPWLLPTEPPSPDMSLSIKEGAYIARYKTEFGELRLQVLRNPPFTLPPELHNALIVANGWSKERPAVDFALVDTDHGVAYDPATPINVENVISALESLHFMTKKVFESMGTPHAIKVWQEEN